MLCVSVLHRTEDHPWSLVAHWWFECPRCRQAKFYQQQQVVVESTQSTLSSNMQTKPSLLKGWNERYCRVRSRHWRRGRKPFSVPWCPWPKTLILCQSKPMRRTAWHYSWNQMRSAGLRRRTMRNMPRWQRKLRNFVRTCKCDQISKCCNFQYSPKER